MVLLRRASMRCGLRRGLHRRSSAEDAVGLTPYEPICKARTENLSLLTADRHDQLPGPNMLDSRRSKSVEKRVRVIASVEDLSPGKDGIIAALLAPGAELVACNRAGHLHAGMSARIIATLDLMARKFASGGE